MVKGHGEKTKMIFNLINMLVSIKLIRRTDMENSPGHQAMFTKATIYKMKEMAMEKCILLMELSIKATGVEAYKLDKRQW